MDKRDKTGTEETRKNPSKINIITTYNPLCPFVLTTYLFSYFYFVLFYLRSRTKALFLDQDGRWPAAVCAFLNSQESIFLQFVGDCFQFTGGH